MVKCWIPGCQAQILPYHKLPTNSNEKRQWLRIISNKKLKNVDKVPQSVSVCRNHFLPTDFNGQRLKRGTRPTQNLSTKASESDSDISLEEDYDPDNSKMDIDFDEHDISLKYTDNPETEPILLDSRRLPFTDILPISTTVLKTQSVETPIKRTPVDSTFDRKVSLDEAMRKRLPLKITINNVDNLRKTNPLYSVNRNNGLGLPVTKFKCPICKISATKHKLLVHYKNVHQLQLNTDKKKFSTMDEFKEWKKSIECQSFSRFVRKYVPNSDYQTSKCEQYACHRNGLFKLGKTKQKLKYVGLKKIEGYCPAKMMVYTQSGGKVTVVYTSTHLGHSTDTNNVVVRSKEDTKTEFDAIQEEAIHSISNDYDDNDDIDIDRSSPLHFDKIPIESPLDNLAAEKKKIKNQLYHIINYVDELKSDAVINMINELLGPVISAICDCQKILNIPQPLVPLVQKTISTPEQKINIQPNAVRLYRLPGNLYQRRFKNSKKTEELTSNNNEISAAIDVGHLNNLPVRVLSNDLHTEIVNIGSATQQNMLPPVTEIKSDPEKSFIARQSNDSLDQMSSLQLKSYQQRNNIKSYSRTPRKSDKIVILSDQSIHHVNEKLLPHISPSKIIRLVTNPSASDSSINIPCHNNQIKFTTTQKNNNTVPLDINN